MIKQSHALGVNSKNQIGKDYYYLIAPLPDLSP